MAERVKENGVMGLSDDELFAKLQEHGFNAGPIVDSTRLIYQKKLIQILDGGYAASPDYSDADDGDVLHGDTAQLSDHEKSIRHRSHQATPSNPITPLPGSSFEYSGSPYGVTSRPSLSTISGRETPHLNLSKSNLSSFSQPKTNQSSTSGFPKSIVIIVFVLAIILAFLFYHNIESNQIPKIEN